MVLMLKRFCLKLIDMYQRTLSPDTGWLRYRYPFGYCKYEPHCSEYGKIAISKYGVLRGSFLALWRIMRCNPWSKGGYDPVK